MNENYHFLQKTVMFNLLLQLAHHMMSIDQNFCSCLFSYGYLSRNCIGTSRKFRSNSVSYKVYKHSTLFYLIYAQCSNMHTVLAKIEHVCYLIVSPVYFLQPKCRLSWGKGEEGKGNEESDYCWSWGVYTSILWKTDAQLWINKS